MDFVKLRDTTECQSMFRSIIKYQIQCLLTQLSNVGEESVLLTACINNRDYTDDNVVGSDIGQSFLNDRSDCLAIFRDYCFIRRNPREVPVTDKSKRKMCMTNGEQSTDDSNSNDVVIPDQKKVKVEPLPIPEAGTDQRETTPSVSLSNETSNYNPALLGMSFSSPNIWSPALTSPSLLGSSLMTPNKTQHKCSQCNYASKFKANVVRHERSIHGINVENSLGPTIQYACTLCTYKSLYRSNLMRHEKNVHKLEPVPQEVDLSRFGMAGVGDLPIVPISHNTESGQSKEGSRANLEQNRPAETRVEASENSSESADSCHVCSFCQLVYPNSQALKEHIDQVHYRTGKFDCGRCRMSFDNNIEYQLHMATHYMARQEKCICGRSFQYRVSLLKHIPKCVVAKETNFKMSDVVLGSGVEMESIYNRQESEQGSSNAQSEQADNEKPNQLGTKVDCELGEMTDIEQGTMKQEMRTGSQYYDSRSEKEQKWYLGPEMGETEEEDNKQEIFNEQNGRNLQAGTNLTKVSER